MSIEKAKFYSLTPTQFYLLEYLFNRNDVDFKYLEEDLEDLQNRKFIKITSQGIILRQRTLDIFEKSQNNYEELWEKFEDMYPKKSGTRRLHDKKSLCKKKYISMIKKDPSLHNEVIKGLEIEIKERNRAVKKGDFMPDWKMMSSYLNQKAWETYLEDIPKELREIDWRDDKI